MRSRKKSSRNLQLPPLHKPIVGRRRNALKALALMIVLGLLIYIAIPDFLRQALATVKDILAWLIAGLQGKSSWEYLEVMVVPLLVGYVITIIQNHEDKRRERALQEGHKEEALHRYFDRALSVAGPSVNHYATTAIRITTLSMLKYFAGDPAKKDAILSFLLASSVIPDSSFSLRGADLTGINLSGCSAFRGADLAGIDFSNAMLKRADFVNTTFSTLDGDDIVKSEFMGTCLVWADLSLARLNHCIIDEANLTLGILSDAELNDASLYKAKLGGVELFRAQLKNADLRGADLRNSWLCDADLRGARLQGALLCGADLTIANLRTVNFNIFSLASMGAADLENADLEGIEWDQATRWPPPELLARARNIPDKLREQLRI